MKTSSRRVVLLISCLLVLQDRRRVTVAKLIGRNSNRANARDRGLVFDSITVEYELYANDTALSCPDRKEVPEDECVQAAFEVSTDITMNATLHMVGSSEFSQCGCVISGDTVHYKNPDVGNCTADANSTLVCRKEPWSDFELYANDTALSCPDRREVPEDECVQAAFEVSTDITMNATLHMIGSSEFSQCGCVISGDTVHYKNPDVDNCTADANCTLVCRKEPWSDFELYPKGGDAGVCADRYEVREDDCLRAAGEVGMHMALSDTLNIGTWSFTPCGCFIYLDTWIDYKDPSVGNCLPDLNSNLICRKEPWSDFELYVDDLASAVICPGGKEVSEDECLQAAFELSDNMTFSATLDIGISSSATPCGCYIQNQDQVYYKQKDNAICSADANSTLLCRKEAVSDYELLAKDAAGICPIRQGVKQEDCFQAAYEAGANISIAWNTFLNVGTWDFAPCGCFIYADHFVDYKDPYVGNCVPDPRANLVCSKEDSGSDFELYSDGASGICEEGKDVTQAECLEAAHQIGSHLPLKGTLNVGTWGFTPCGCFIFNKLYVDYKDPDVGNCVPHANSNLVCRKEIVLHELYANGASGICPDRKEVTEEECLQAARDVKNEKTLKDYLNVGTWHFTPCGCFLYHNDWIDYKSPDEGNCLPDPNSNLVCRKDVRPAFELHTAVEAGVCPEGKEVPIQECLQAAHEVGGDMALAEILKVGSWPTTPCGCFIYDESFVDYKDPDGGNCVPNSNSNLVCRIEKQMNASVALNTNYDLYANGAVGSCPGGKEVFEEDCLQAAHEAGYFLMLDGLADTLNVGTWSFTPCGCFIYQNGFVDYKDPLNGNCLPDSNSNVVCRKQVWTNLTLYPAGEAGFCPDGKEVSIQECLQAAHEIGYDMTLKEELNVGSWDTTPCGCFIYGESSVDYKDPAYGNCSPHLDSNLVCYRETQNVTFVSNFELYEGGSSSICPEGKAITEKECLHAAQEVGSYMKLRGLVDDLNVGAWDFTPCGCFVNNYDTADYKSPLHGNCSTDPNANPVCRKEALPAFELRAHLNDTEGICPQGKAVNRKDCLRAAHEVGVNMTLSSTLNIGSWDFLPCGCFIYTDEWVDYKSPDDGNCIPAPYSIMVCRTELSPSTRTLDPPANFELREYGAGEICERGKAVTEAECLQAAHDIASGLTLKTLKDFLNVGTWDFLPCGCFIYDDLWVDFKHPLSGNCVSEPKAQLVCRKEAAPACGFLEDEAAGICPNELGVSEHECLEAALEAGIGLPLKQVLNVGTWDYLPCGCFIHDNHWVDYKDPENGNCLPDSKSKLVCRKDTSSIIPPPITDFELYGIGAAGICPDGHAVKKLECLEAAREVGLGMVLAGSLNIGSWDFTPCGCFIYDGEFIDYKHPGDGNCVTNVKSKLVCRKDKIVIPGSLVFGLHFDEAAGHCPENYDVAEDRCLEAAREAGIGMTLTDFLNVGTWDFLPCGCFIHENQLVYYKHPDNGNCLPDSKSDLVCIKEKSNFVGFSLHVNVAASVCPDDCGVAENECLEAAHEVGVGMTLTEFVNVGSWSYLPCGCFIYNGEWVDYKDPNNGNCVPDTSSQLVCKQKSSTGSIFELYGTGVAGICPDGHAVKKQECLEAARVVGNGLTLANFLNIGSWDFAPCGCFIYDGKYIDYKHPDDGNCLADPKSNLVCVKKVTAPTTFSTPVPEPNPPVPAPGPNPAPLDPVSSPSPNEGTSYKLFAYGAASVCPGSTALTQEECLGAAHGIGSGLALSDSLINGTWGHVPCGCFIYEDHFVQYKHIDYCSCTADEQSRLICVDEATFKSFPSVFVINTVASDIICPEGKEVAEEECFHAAREAGISMMLEGILNVGSWDNMPCGCFILDEKSINYKNPIGNNCLTNSDANLVCRREVPTPPPTLSPTAPPTQAPTPPPVFHDNVVLYNNGEGGVCEEGKEVGMAECLQAAQEAGIGMALKETLNVGSWSSTPCGCFIYKREWIDYKDPSHGNCQADQNSNLICRKDPSDFELLPDGTAGICEEGKAITEHQCLQAAQEAGVFLPLKDELNVGSWWFTPCGCFIYKREWIDYKDPSHGNCLPDSNTNLVCKKKSADFELLPDGTASICEEGKAITEHQCLQAAHEAGMGMPLKDELNVGSWWFTPCGCFIYKREWIDYKDPSHGNCLPDSNTNLVCRTVRIDFELLPDGYGGVCDDEKGLSEHQCLQAAREAGMGMPLKDELNVGSWSFTPCGCFIYKREWIDYKDPSHGNCLPDPNTNLVCRREPPSDFELFGPGALSICPGRKTVTEQECLQAGLEVGFGLALPETLIYGSFPSMPCGCFIYKLSRIIYKDPIHGACNGDSQTNLVCRTEDAPTLAPTLHPTEFPTEIPTPKPSPAPSPKPSPSPTSTGNPGPPGPWPGTSAPTQVPTIASTNSPTHAPTPEPTAVATLAPTPEPTIQDSLFRLYPLGDIGICPEGTEVIDIECSQAAIEVGSNFTLLNTLIRGSWESKPCGCFIYNGGHIEYKDPLHGNCLADLNSNLICRKDPLKVNPNVATTPAPTGSPTPVPVPAPVIVPTLSPTPVPTVDPNSNFELYDIGSHGICPDGKSVEEDECLQAAHEVGPGMTLRTDLNVGSWDFLPCGCFIYINNWVDYKNPDDGNCLPDSKSNLICRKEKLPGQPPGPKYQLYPSDSLAICPDFRAVSEAECLEAAVASGSGMALQDTLNVGSWKNTPCGCFIYDNKWIDYKDPNHGNCSPHPKATLVCMCSLRLDYS